MSFEQLGLNKDILKAIAEKGYTKPSPIQEKAIPEILKGNDVLASAQTGTGKTAGFTLPILDLLSKAAPSKKRKIRALILTPTRELAAQVLEEVKTYSKHLNVQSFVIFGGVNENPQKARLRQGVDILVATPGRLLDLHAQKVFSLSQVEMFVLDEADRMLDMGFQRDIQKVLKVIPNQRQTLLFSATFSKEIKKLANGVLDNPIEVETAPQNSTAKKVNQIFYRVDKGRKAALVSFLISQGKWDQVLIFTRTKHGANRLAEKLNKVFIKSAAIHGNKSQNARTKALADFKSGKIAVLVATDIAARGLDIPLLPHVINYELPNQPEDYVHRIGRTGRAGAAGDAISLVGQDEKEYYEKIKKLLNQELKLEFVKDYEPSEAMSESAGGNSNDRNKKSSSKKPFKKHRKPYFKKKNSDNKGGRRKES